jgi:hypothetical protein
MDVINTYEDLLNRRIDLEFQGKHVNSFKITELIATNEIMPAGPEGNGRVYAGKIEWTNKNIAGCHPDMNYPESILSDLINKKKSVCEYAPDVCLILCDK